MTDIAAWQNRLEATFGHDGTIGNELGLLDESEAKYGAWVVGRFHGFMSISESFLVLHFGIPELLNHHVLKPMKEAKDASSSCYGMCVVRHLTDFRTLRAARSLLFQGAPYQGLTLLRPVFDGALIRSAIMQKLTTCEAVDGATAVQPGKPIDLDLVRRARIREERRIDSIMVGDESQLSNDTKDLLAQWEGLLHAEIHGGRLSQASALKWLQGMSSLSFMPEPDEREVSMLLNRWVEMAWMVHRLMPTLQLEKYRFPKEWRERWTVLDESFLPMVQALSKELGKQIGEAMVEFVNKKFPFNADSFCPV